VNGVKRSPFRIGLILTLLLITVPGFAQPQLLVNREVLDFGAVNGTQTGSQTFFVDNAGDGTLNWSASSEQDWLTLQPNSGTGSGSVTVTVDPGSMPADFYYSGIDILNADNPNDRMHVSGILNVYDPGGTMAPFGSFDTPMDGASVSGTIPVTGWALDDIGLDNVSIFRDDGANYDYIGDAVFVEGARPDVETMYPGYPQNYQAGWGYMMLTNHMPDGNYTLYAFANDAEGNQTLLGTKNITVDNANAVKPFGAIDTPMQGGVASGSQYKVSGWALTPQPNHIPTDGSTINVYVDDVNLGNPTYNMYRQDIADLFPGYENSNAAGAYFYLNTTEYENGVHTIQWTATDSDGNTDGIGSRYFTIQNPDMPTPVSNRKSLHWGAEPGAQTGTQTVTITNSGQDIDQQFYWGRDEEEQPEWIDVQPPVITEGPHGDVFNFLFEFNGDDMAPGFYQGELNISDPNAGLTTVDITASISDGSYDFPPFGSFDTPQDGRMLSGSIPITGWALDEVGVQSVKIYSSQEGGDPTYIGDAVLVDGARPDLVQSKPITPMNYKAGWGYMLMTNFLPDGDGQYTLEAIATNKSGQETSLGTKTVIVDNANAVKPFGAIDSPVWGGTVSRDQVHISGWALTPQPNTIPTDGSTISIYVDGQFAGHPTYNQYREDIATLLPGYTNSNGAGWEIDLTSFGLDLATHVITVRYENGSGGSSKVLNSDEATVMSQYFIVDSTVPPSDVENLKDTLPGQIILHPVYPNPFNPSTKILYQLNQPSRVDLTIFDLRGRQVRSLLSGHSKDAGIHEMEWQGLNDSGIRVSSGVYFLILKSESRMKTQKILLIR